MSGRLPDEHAAGQGRVTPPNMGTPWNAVGSVELVQFLPR
jgi:hypothetical protein